jgi:hypothetical protein
MLATGVAAAALVALLLLAAPGSIQVLARAKGQTPMPKWAAPCSVVRPPSLGVRPLTYCARVDGRVIASLSENGERHVLVTGGFHLTLVELPRGARSPGWGSRIVAVGPLQAGSFGLRELIVQSTRR